MLVEERLIAGHEVDDRQATAAEPQPWREMETVAIWSAMTADIGYQPQQDPIDPGESAIIIDKTSVCATCSKVACAKPATGCASPGN